MRLTVVVLLVSASTVHADRLVVVVGDSHTVGPTSPGGRLAVHDSRVILYGRRGRSAVSLLEELTGLRGEDAVRDAWRMGSSLLERFVPPAVDDCDVVLWLGTNDADSRDLRTSAWAFEVLAGAANLRGCRPWVVEVPPFDRHVVSHVHRRKLESRAAELRSLLSEVNTDPDALVFPVIHVDGLPTRPPGRAPDGIHFATSGARVWARGVAVALGLRP